MLLSNEWYWENTAGIILTDKGSQIIKSLLRETDICLECGENLTIITMMEGTFIVCENNMYHKNDIYKIDCGDYTKPPKLIRKHK
jgi:hypothetical protein